MTVADLHLNDKTLFNDRRVNEATAMLMQPLRKHLSRCAKYKQSAMRILIASVFLFSACTNSDSIRKDSDKSLKNAEERPIVNDFKTSGKGLYYENCLACHNGINSTEAGKSFVEIVNNRSVEWAYNYIMDSSILAEQSKTQSEHARRHPTYMNTISKQDLEKIWEFVRSSEGPVH